MTGLYITIEGPESSGKSTQARMLVEYLNIHYPLRQIALTKEPGSPSDSLCSKIRNLILDKNNLIEEKSAFLLFLADRAQHIKKVVKPALAKGHIVISDRSSLSCLVYHFASLSDQDINSDYQNLIFKFLDFAQEIPPDFSFIASSDFSWAKSKISQRTQKDRIESFDDHFHIRVHALFNLLECQTNEHFDVLRNTAFANICNLKCLPKRLIKLPPANHHSLEEIQNLILKPILSSL